MKPARGHQLNVGDLIALLQTLPPHLKVEIEGWDSDGLAVGVIEAEGEDGHRCARILRDERHPVGA